MVLNQLYSARAQNRNVISGQKEKIFSSALGLLLWVSRLKIYVTQVWPIKTWIHKSHGKTFWMALQNEWLDKCFLIRIWETFIFDLWGPREPFKKGHTYIDRVQDFSYYTKVLLVFYYKYNNYFWHGSNSEYWSKQREHSKINETIIYLNCKFILLWNKSFRKKQNNKHWIQFKKEC